MAAPSLCSLYVAAFLGAAMLWISSRYGKLLAISIDDFINELSDHFKFRTIVSLVVCSLIGAILAIFWVEPASLKQAFAAGLGWSGLIGSIAPTIPKKAKVR